MQANPLHKGTGATLPESAPVHAPEAVGNLSRSSRLRLLPGAPNQGGESVGMKPAQAGIETIMTDGMKRPGVLPWLHL